MVVMEQLKLLQCLTLVPDSDEKNNIFHFTQKNTNTVTQKTQNRHTVTVTVQPTKQEAVTTTDHKTHTKSLNGFHSVE